MYLAEIRQEANGENDGETLEDGSQIRIEVYILWIGYPL